MVCPAFDQSFSSGRKTADQTRVESEVSGSCAGMVTGIEIKTRSPGGILGYQVKAVQGWPCTGLEANQDKKVVTQCMVRPALDRGGKPE
jgi:hypothetical protein